MCGVQAAELAVRAGVEAGGGAALPGMILNTSKETTYTNAATGREHSVPAGRMECTMQVRPYSHICYMSIFHLTLQTTAASANRQLLVVSLYSSSKRNVQMSLILQSGTCSHDSKICAADVLYLSCHFTSQGKMCNKHNNAPGYSAICAASMLLTQT